MHKQSLFISVVVTTYNRKELLSETLRSILCQTFNNFELIIVDNMSGDGTKEFIEGLNDDRIKYIRHDNEGIIAVNRNIGIRKASGKYVAFCDDDDLWLPNKLEFQFEIMESEGLGLTFGFSEIIGTPDASSHLLFSKNECLSINNYENLLLGNRIGFSSAMVKSECFERIGLFDENPEFKAIEDYDLWLRIANSYKIKCIPKVLCKYRVHNNNISSDQAKEKQKLIKLLNKIEQNKWATSKMLKKARSNIYWGIGNALLINGDKLYRNWFLKAFIQKITLKSLFGLLLFAIPKTFAIKLFKTLKRKKIMFKH